jgi:protein arginine kinase activator
VIDMAVVCQICKVRPAKIHYTEIVNNNMVTLNLCVECAEERGIDVDQAGGYGLGDLVAGLIDSAVDIESDKIGKVRCPSCGYEYSDFKKTGRFGCPECYEAFEAQLLPLLRQIHGNTHHSGTQPVDIASRAAHRRKVSDLRADLQRAVDAEDYERAAEIRDQIRDMEVGGPGASDETSAAETSDVDERKDEG